MNQCAVLLMVSTCLIFVRGGVHLYSFTFAIHHSLFPPFQAALFWGKSASSVFSQAENEESGAIWSHKDSRNGIF